MEKVNAVFNKHISIVMLNINFFSVDSDKCRDLVDAVQIPIKSTIPLFDDSQFPPMTTVGAD